MLTILRPIRVLAAVAFAVLLFILAVPLLGLLEGIEWVRKEGQP